MRGGEFNLWRVSDSEGRTDLKYDARDNHSELEQQEIGCGVKVIQVYKSQVVVRAVKAGRYKVEQSN